MKLKFCGCTFVYVYENEIVLKELDMCLKVWAWVTIVTHIHKRVKVKDMEYFKDLLGLYLEIYKDKSNHIAIIIIIIIQFSVFRKLEIFQYE